MKGISWVFLVFIEVERTTGMFNDFAFYKRDLMNGAMAQLDGLSPLRGCHPIPLLLIHTEDLDQEPPQPFPFVCTADAFSINYFCSGRATVHR